MDGLQWKTLLKLIFGGKPTIFGNIHLGVTKNPTGVGKTVMLQLGPTQPLWPWRPHPPLECPNGQPLKLWKLSTGGSVSLLEVMGYDYPSWDVQIILICCSNLESFPTRWFKVTFSFPSWRSLNLWNGHFNHPKKVTKNCQILKFNKTVLPICTLVDFQKSRRTSPCKETGQTPLEK